MIVHWSKKGKKRYFFNKIKNTNKKTLNRRDLILGVIASYYKKYNKMVVIFFFSFLFCYINCKVGNLCILNKVYKDDKFFSIYTHTCLCKCMYVCMYIYICVYLEFLFIHVSICNSSHQTKISDMSLAACPYSTPKPLSSPWCQLLKQDLKRKIECTRKK